MLQNLRWAHMIWGLYELDKDTEIKIIYIDRVRLNLFLSYVQMNRYEVLTTLQSQP